MAISIDWGTRVINVPRADMLLVQSVPSEIRELDLDAFRLALKDLEDSEDGMPFPDTHVHNTIVTLGGVTYARVIEITNGYTVTFEDGQYAVNLVGANSNVGDTTNVNQVSVRSSNSAGLTYSKEIEDQSFLDGRVWIDTIDGQAGTQFPQGTHGSPVLTHSEADFIVSQRGLGHRYALRGFISADVGGDGLEDEDWMGNNSITSGITFTNGVSIANSIFQRLTLEGDCTGRFTLESGFINDMTNFEGDCHIVGFGGTVVVPSGSFIGNRILKDCYSSVPGNATPIFDFNNATDIKWQFRGWLGGLAVKNYTDANNNLSIDLDSGHVIIDASCTAGTIVVRGAGHITNNAVGVTVVNKGLTYTQGDKLLKKKEWIALS